ncbi:Smg-4/UPF3 family-domain-containing protein [Xylariaceae sp. FL1019]|nr:Smg-4/UPF3 family-domain-containing protein [Xylariaceae sp. FL1019]
MAKQPAEGKKVVVRRLPPGMTEEEFWKIIGDEWKVGNGKVDWAHYDNGDIAYEASDYSTPAAAWLHVLKNDFIPLLGDVVSQLKWEDAKQTQNDPALIAPPCVELALNQKIPTHKKRTDPRQGTIDTDPEFMAFLESLTSPNPPKEADPDQLADETSKAETKVTTTPLVEAVKEKRAAKAKEAALAKSAKQHARHESQTKGKEDAKKKGKESKGDKADKSGDKDAEKGKQPVKLLTKKAAAQEAAEASKAGSSSSASTSNKTGEEAAPKSRRANIAAAAKILQRDLGLSPGSAHRKARQDAAKADTTVKPDATKETKEVEPKETTPKASASQPTPAASNNIPTAPKAQLAETSRRSRGAKGAKQASSSGAGKGKENESATTGKAPPMTMTPVILKRKDDTASTPAGSSTPTANAATTPTPTAPTAPKAILGKATNGGKSTAAGQKKGAPNPSVTSGATRGFVKHANPSQGVTEPLLKQAMEVFGPVTFVEIDKRKGFAYVDFRDHDGLLKAITASPISVAQGTVQVLERKEKKVAATPAVAQPAATTTPTQSANDKKAAEATAGSSKRGGRGRGRRGGANASTTGGSGESGGSSTAVAATSAAPAG